MGDAVASTEGGSLISLGEEEPAIPPGAYGLPAGREQGFFLQHGMPRRECQPGRWAHVVMSMPLRLGASFQGHACGWGLTGTRGLWGGKGVEREPSFLRSFVLATRDM